MSSNFPTSLDTLTNPTATDYLNSPSHSAQHANANDICEALEAKVGIDGSAVATSHDKILASGWKPYSAVVPTRASADDPTYVLTFAGVDLTGVISVPMKVKFTQNSATVYGIITAISFSTNTTMTLYCGTDYDVLDTGTYPISAFNYSPHKAPFGFPLNPTKWSILTTSSSSRSTATPTAGTWYNAENIIIPIGCWLVSYSCNTGGNNNSSDLDFFSTLSTANNSESDTEFTANTQLSIASYLQTTMGRDKYLTLAAKTTYYLNYMTNRTSVEEVNIAGNRSKTMIRAVCAYL
jgi:hypothetical protein